MSRNQWLFVAIASVVMGAYAVARVIRVEKLHGGLASGKKRADFNAAALREGAKVEREHTDDPALAEEIAMDHLTEDPQYYKKLKAAGL